jgi:hypothetical protein
MKEATKRLISNETLQERSIRLENATKRYAAKNQVKRYQKELVDLSMSLQKAKKSEKIDQRK